MLEISGRLNQPSTIHILKDIIVFKILSILSQKYIKETFSINMMLNIFLFEKAVYEVGYELNNRPDWIMIPLKGIKRLLED